MKYNLTIVDKNPDIKNFIYAGVSESCLLQVKEDFKNKNPVLHFKYDEGEVLVSVSEIHSLVISDYSNDLDDTLEGEI